MKLALYLPNFRNHVTVKELEDLTDLAEELDFDSVWTLDRVIVPEASDRGELQYPFGMMEQFPLQMPVASHGQVVPGLAAAALARRPDHEGPDRDEHHRHPYRSPGVFAAECATIDHLSGGRLNVGVGAGWMPEEFAAASATHLFPRRHAHVRETIEICQGIWQNEIFEYHGEFADFEPSRLRPPAAAEAVPADLLQRPEGRQALGQPGREVRPRRAGSASRTRRAS